jgi:outer membrane protein assembly factor BamB
MCVALILASIVAVGTCRIGNVAIGQEAGGAQTEAPSQSPDSVRQGVLLLEAARTGDLAEVQRLIADKVDVNSPSAHGATPLALACDHGHDAVVETLIAAGADVNAKDSFYRATPITWAIMRKHPTIVERLVKAGADALDDALASAVASGEEKLVQPILQSDRVSETGLTAALKSAREAKADAIAKQIEAKLPESLRAMPPAEAAKETPAHWNALVGTYRHEAGSTLKAIIESGELALRSDDSDRSMVLTPEALDQFSLRGATIIFRKEADKVVSMVMKVGEAETVFVRIDEAAPATPASEPPMEAKLVLRQDFAVASENWPSFRGTLARGLSSSPSLPKEWDAASGKGIVWKTPIPGLGTSSPIVWGSRVFITTAIQPSDTQGFRVGAYGDVDSVVGEGECQYVVLCLDRDSGAIVWQKEAAKSIPTVKRHAKSSHANPTPATDGTHVLVSFGGAGVFCYDFEGNLQWTRSFGTLDSGWFYDKSYQWGFGSSPFIFDRLAILQCDVQEGAFLIAVDVATGETRWEVKRDEITTWSSPVGFVADDGTPTIVVSGTKCSAAYDARDGKELWKLGGFSEIVVPTPQITRDVAVLTSGYAPVQPIVVLKHAARGPLTMPEDKQGTDPFVWNTQRGGPYMPTPIVVNDKLFVLDNGGVLSAYKLDRGERVFRQRIRTSEANAYTASPIAGAGMLYLTAEVGMTFVVDGESDGTIVAQNSIGESVLATPAFGGNKLFIRGEKHLFAIGTP